MKKHISLISGALMFVVIYSAMDIIKHGVSARTPVIPFVGFSMHQVTVLEVLLFTLTVLLLTRNVLFTYLFTTAALIVYELLWVAFASLSIYDYIYGVVGWGGLLVALAVTMHMMHKLVSPLPLRLSKLILPLLGITMIVFSYLYINDFFTLGHRYMYDSSVPDPNVSGGFFIPWQLSKITELTMWLPLVRRT